jgi:hypothetical protein
MAGRGSSTALWTRGSALATRSSIFRGGSAREASCGGKGSLLISTGSFAGAGVRFAIGARLVGLAFTAARLRVAGRGGAVTAFSDWTGLAGRKDTEIGSNWEFVGNGLRKARGSKAKCNAKDSMKKPVYEV